MEKETCTKRRVGIFACKLFFLLVMMEEKEKTKAWGYSNSVEAE